MYTWLGEGAVEKCRPYRRLGLSPNFLKGLDVYHTTRETYISSCIFDVHEHTLVDSINLFGLF